jgi:hypothetical protein
MEVKLFIWFGFEKVGGLFLGLEVRLILKQLPLLVTLSC